MATLRELGAYFLRHEVRTEARHYRGEDGKSEVRIGPVEYYVKVETLAEAQGIEFLCPLCFAQNKGEVGTHGVVCWFNGRGVPDTATPGPGRWNPSGHGLDDLTFVPPGAVSVQLLGGGCKWHGFVAGGRAV